MTQFYFFFKPDKFRNDNKIAGTISYNLKAYFTITRDQSKKPFKKLDDINIWYNRFTTENFEFELDSGVDSCEVHYADDEKEFLRELSKDGYFLISEKNYLRYRKLVTEAFLKYSKLDDIIGEERYFFSNRTSRYFKEALLCKIRYKKDSYPFNVNNHFIKTNYINDFKIVETNTIFLAKSDELLCNKFKSTAFKNMMFYKSWESAISASFEKSDNLVEISHLQYARLRKLLKSMMVKKSPLKLIKFDQPKDYYFRHSD